MSEQRDETSNDTPTRIDLPNLRRNLPHAQPAAGIHPVHFPLRETPMAETQPILTLDDLPAEAVEGRAVFVRVDFNVPIKDQKVLDATRIVGALPTIRTLLERGAFPVLGSHRGRPKGHFDPALSLLPVAKELEHRLGAPVAFCRNAIGEQALGAVRALTNKQRGSGVLLLENLRFHAGEKANDPEFVAELSKLADCYVNDAFGTAHRAHASTVGLAAASKHKAAGALLEREVGILGGLLASPKRPFLAILGGAKISGKLETMQSLVETADRLAVGGGMANTLLAASGHAMAASLVEVDLLDTARNIINRCKERSVELILPADLVVTESLSEEQASPPTVRTLSQASLASGEMAVDIGPLSQQAIAQAIASSATVFWNGPLGVFEVPPFDAGSVAIAEALSACEGFTAVGGGETVAAVNAAGGASSINHISTGGGASLELLAAKPLPGVEALRKGAAS